MISIQSPLNGCISDLLRAKNGDTIIDGCAAPGSKGTYISNVAPKSKILSIDINQNRMKLMKENINREQKRNIKLMLADLTKDSFDKVAKMILDVPCSGTGVVNRRADLKWKKSFSDISRNTKIQRKMLSNCSKYIKKGGILVYSTCSIEIEENQDIINNFLSDNKNFVLEDAADYVDNKIVYNKMINVLPGMHELDGGFAARLKRIS